MALNTVHNVPLSTDQLWQLIELVKSNNQYNEDEEEIESWNEIVTIFENELETFYNKVEKAQSKQPDMEW